MKLRFFTSIFLLSAVWVMAATTPLAVVVRFKGEVLAGPETAMKPATAGLVLMDGTRLRTGSDGRALVRFLADQSITEIKPGTTVDFSSRERGDGQGTARQVLLRAGEAAFGVTPGKGRDLRFETATTVASVRGTGFNMLLSLDGKTTIYVEHGVVHVCNKSTGESRNLNPGESINSGWDGLFADSTSHPRLDTLKVDSIHVQKMEIDFHQPVTGTTSTLGLGTVELHP